MTLQDIRYLTPSQMGLINAHSQHQKFAVLGVPANAETIPDAQVPALAELWDELTNEGYMSAWNGLYKEAAPHLPAVVPVLVPVDGKPSVRKGSPIRK